MSQEEWAYNALNERMRKSTMARERDEYDVAGLRAELEAVKAERAAEHAAFEQLRSDYALVRAEVNRYAETQKETELQKQAFARFLKWVALSAEQKTQLVADRDYNADLSAGPLWEVSFPEHPKVKLRANSEYDLVGRYNKLCGITATDPNRQHTMTLLESAAA